MKLLLDTCAFLWIDTGSPELTPRVRETFSDPANDIFLSAVSAWEIAIKHALGKLPLPVDPERFVTERRAAYHLDTLPLDEESALYSARLPDLHRDPFDRALIGQAVVHGLTLLTPDQRITQYAVRTIW